MIAKPAPNQIEIKLNMSLFQNYTNAVLYGDNTMSIFPRVKIEQTDESETFLFLEASILENPEDKDGKMTAEITIDLQAGSFNYGLFAYCSPVVSRGEIIDPGGWEIDENSYKGPFSSITDLARSMKADLAAIAAQKKAEAESEKDLERTSNSANRHRPFPEYCPICRGDCLYDANPEAL